MSFIDVDVVDHVARVTVNRPAYRNAQSRILLEQLDESLLALGRDDDVRVIVLLGAGEHFSAGHDLGTPDELADQAERPWRGGIRGWYEKTWEVDLRQDVLAV
ncbi:MAG: enoyl-CoA hydratase-related protein [Acidimicrobiales bacterium]